jgi:hypothetical protein
MLSPETKKFKAKKISALIGLCLLSIIIGCTNNTDENASPKEMKTFSLGTVSTPGEFAGTIEGKDIDVTVPYGTNVTALVATFTITGESVDIYLTEQVSGETPNDFSYPVVYTVVGADGSKQNYTVTVTEAPSSAKEIKTFSLGTFAGTINEAGKTIAVIVPLGTNVTALVAIYTITGESVSIGSTVQTNGQTPNDFTNPVVYTVKAADASTTPYTVTVTFNELATAVRVSMTPNTPAPHVGIFCTATSSITGSYTVTDPNGGSVIVMEWYDNDVLRQTTTKTLANGETSGTDTLLRPFLYHHYIKFKVTADGVVSDSVINRIL